MADSSTTTAPILGLIAGDCWARRQLPSGIKDISVASKLRKSLTFVGVVFIGTLGLQELNVRFLHDRWSDPVSDCGRLLGSIPASQWCKIHPSATFIHEVTGLNGVLAIPELYDRLLHNHLSDPGSHCGGLLGSTPATQRYKGRLCRIETHEIADTCGGCLYRYPGDPRTRWLIPPQPLVRSWI